MDLKKERIHYLGGGWYKVTFVSHAHERVRSQMIVVVEYS